MGKRKSKDKDVESLYRKIKRLKKSLKKRDRSRSKEKDVENDPPRDEIVIEDQEEIQEVPVEQSLEEGTLIMPNQIDTNDPTEFIDEILGEDPTKKNKYGVSIHEYIASRWGHIAKEGLPKDIKNELQKQILIPDNCQFLEAPLLNLEIKAAISDLVLKRDNALQYQQNLLGQATASIRTALNILLQDKKSNLQITKSISNAGRLLCDIFHTQSIARRSSIQFALNKDTKDIVSQTIIDKNLFGDNLSEVLKAGKAIHKTGSEIRYTKPSLDKPKQKQNPSLNFRGPPRKPRPPAPSAGRPTHQHKAKQRTATHKTAPPYKHRR